MASIQFDIKRPHAEKSAIACTLSDGRDYKIKLYPGISIKPKHWSKRNQNVLSADPHSASYNKHLEDYSKKVMAAYLKAKNKGFLPGMEYFKKELEPEKKESTDFWKLWDAYLKSKAGIFKHHSFVKFDSLKTHLEEFEKVRGNLVIDNITSELLEDLQAFMYDKRKLNTQSTQKYIGILKMFLNWCLKRRYSANSDFKNFTAIRQPDSLKVIMTDVDIRKIKKLALKGKNHLRNVRALFLLACNCGLRYSDFSRIDASHLKKGSDGYSLQIRQEKTEDFVSIPLTAESLKTVKDLISGKLHSITNQRMNEYVKDLCELAEIDEPFEVHKYVGRNKTTKTVPKHDLVTTHTGRRTFASKLLERGVPAEVVMKFTGHRDYKSFQKYVNIPPKAEMKLVRTALEGKAIMWKSA